MKLTEEAREKRREGGRTGSKVTNSNLSAEERSTNARHAALALAKKMTPAQRSERARKAANTRFSALRKAREEASL